MPEKSSFFDSTAGDERLYASRDFAEYFAQFLTNGVFKSGTNLSVTSTGSDANVRVNPGYAWINGYMYNVYDSYLTLPIQPATTQDRIDRIILRLDVSTPVRSIKAIVVQGQPSASPVAPALVRSGNIYDISIAQIRVKAGSSIVLPANITDERENPSVCGLVNSLIRDGNDASLTQKGVVQLSNAINGTRENVAATEKAVKLAVDASRIPYTNKTYINRGLSSQVPLTGGNVFNVIKFDGNKDAVDTLSEYNTSTGILSVKESGIYYIELYLTIGTTGIATLPSTYLAAALLGEGSNSRTYNISEVVARKEDYYAYLHGSVMAELRPSSSYKIAVRSTDVSKEVAVINIDSNILRVFRIS